MLLSVSQQFLVLLNGNILGSEAQSLLLKIAEYKIFLIDSGLACDVKPPLQLFLMGGYKMGIRNLKLTTEEVIPK